MIPLNRETEGNSLGITKKQGTAAGTYEDTIAYQTEEGAEASFTARMVLEDSEQPETPEGSALSADLELMEFRHTGCSETDDHE